MLLYILSTMAYGTSLFVVAINLISSKSFNVNSPNKRLSTRIQAEERSSDPNACGPNSERFILPIFPLRKAVKVPTESLTLNLYEGRYLALAEYVLASPNRMFGGIYCSEMAQIVKNGVGPIVPMVETGDVGVVCKIVYDAEAMVPTVGGDTRRRIKLEGFAVGRFRIEVILHNGYGDSFVEGEGALPFILAEVSRIDDLSPSEDESLQISKLEEQILSKVKQRDGIGSDRVIWNLDTTGDEDEVILASLSPFLFSPGSTLTNKEEMSTYNEAIFSWEKVESNLDDHRRQQLFSYAMVSLVSTKKPASETLPTLDCQSTYERLRYVEKNLSKGKGRPFW